MFCRLLGVFCGFFTLYGKLWRRRESNPHVLPKFKESPRFGVNMVSNSLLTLKWSIDNGAGSRNCRIVFRKDKKRVVIPITPATKNKNVAYRLAPQLIEEWFKVRGGITEPGEALKSLIERYIALEYPDLKPSTTKEVRRLLEKMTSVCDATDLKQLTREWVESRVKTLRGDLSPKSWSNFLAVMRKFFRWCIVRKMIAEDPTAGIPTPKSHTFGGRGLLDLWDDDRFNKTVEKLDEYHGNILLVFWKTGMDSSDVYTLAVENIVEKAGNWFIRKKRVKGKTSRELIDQPISKEILPFIKSQIKGKAGTERVFSDLPNSSPSMFEQRFRRRVQLAQSKAGFKDIRDIKSIRHTFATRHAERGVPERQLKKWMGHVPESKTLEKLYIHLESDPTLMD